MMTTPVSKSWSGDAAAEKLERLADCCRSYSGDMTLLWHNSNLVTRDDRLGYQRIIDLLA